MSKAWVVIAVCAFLVLCTIAVFALVIYEDWKAGE